MRTILKNLWKWIASAAAVASIFGVVLFFMADNVAVITALTFICILLLIITSYIIYTLQIFIKQNHVKDYDTIASFAEYRCDNRTNSTYDTYRLIQCKRPMLAEIKYHFKWSGSVLPKISSNCQDIKRPVHISSPDEWDYAILELKRPLTYNECTVLHVHTENDDTDGTASPYISLKVEFPISYIQFRVLLSYKPKEYNRVATFERRKITSNVETDWEAIASIPFDTNYKSYTCMQERPTPGFYYRLSWEK